MAATSTTENDQDEDAEVHVAEAKHEKDEFSAPLALDAEMQEMCMNFIAARDALNAARRARGFYPIMAAVPPSSLNEWRASPNAKASPPAGRGGQQKRSWSAPAPA